MKREYVKPYLAVESFQITAALAANCENIPDENGNLHIGDFVFFDMQSKCLNDFYDDDAYSYLGTAWQDLKATYQNS